MRLAELNPKWLIKDGVRVGFVFRSPTRMQCWQSCFFIKSPPRRQQWLLFRAAFGLTEDEQRHDIQGCKEGCQWRVTNGTVADADFETIYIMPSLDGSPGGNWHGHITSGRIVGGIRHGL